MTNVSALDRVLMCPTLPSLPGVAMRVLELTRKKDLSMQTLGEAVQTDPALVARVLKTVNSSYYGLTTPCPSISRAMSLLGMNTVRSIVLGFSLLDMGKASTGGAKIDLSDYWRRAVYGAAGAKLVAKQLRDVDPEEAFLGALMRDLGMLACIAALRDEYINVMMSAAADHNALPAIEREALGFDHTQVGAQLATKWRLPDTLSQSISFHHKPDLAEPQYANLVSCVAIGGYIAGALSAAEPKPYLALVASRGERWLKLSRDVTKQLLADTAKQAKELGTVLDVSTGPSANIESILADAQEQLVLGNAELERQAQDLQQRNDQLAKQTITDSLTQAFNRSHFDTTLNRCYTECKDAGTPFSLLFFDADKFKSINDTLGHQAGDAVLRELSKRSRETVAEQSGIVCRYGGEEFGIILPEVSLADAEKLAERLRAAMDAKPFDLSQWGVAGATPRVTISVGVSGVDAQTVNSIEKAEDVTHAADQGVYQAKETGRNRVCSCAPGATPRIVSQGVGFTLQAKTPDVAQPAGSQAASQAKPEATKPAPAALKPAQAATAVKPAVPAVASPKVAPQQPAAAPAKVASLVQPKVPQATPSPTAGAPSQLLVLIEDDPLAAKLLELLFSKRTGYTIKHFTSAETMLMWAMSPEFVQPSLVLCDSQLPGLSGVNVVAVVRGHPKLRESPVALMSARVDDALLSSARSVGCPLLLSKAELCTNFDATLGKIKVAIQSQQSQASTAA